MVNESTHSNILKSKVRELINLCPYIENSTGIWMILYFYVYMIHRHKVDQNLDCFQPHEANYLQKHTREHPSAHPHVVYGQKHGELVDHNGHQLTLDLFG